MSAWLRRAATLAVLLALLAVPGTSAADHVSISGSVGAVVTEIEKTRVVIRITYELICNGASGGASYTGNLNMVNEKTGEERFLGGTSSGSGEEIIHETRTNEDRMLYASLKANCFENSSAHGSETKEFISGTVLVPAKQPGSGGGGGGGGGSGGGGGGGSSGGGPTDPLAAGGCEAEVTGTPQADQLVGGSAGDLISSLGGDDRVSGGDGHDCLIGGTGDDRLKGQDDRDRLTGGSGNDLLVGGPGKNAYDAGSGKDRVKAKNGKRDEVDCGPGKDSARTDPADDLTSCEKVSG